MAEMGPLSVRAPMGHRARGLQRERQCVGLLHARPGALARLSLGRGRHRRHFRRSADPLLRAGAVERQGPDPEGAVVRPHQQRGQSRRGREGILLLPRLHAHALVHEISLQVPAAGVSLCRPDPEQPPQPRGIRVRAARHRRLRRRPLFRRVRRVRQGIARRHPDPHHRAQSRARGGGPGRSADAMVPESPGRPTRTPRARSCARCRRPGIGASWQRPATPSSARASWPAKPPPTCSSPRTKPTTCACSRPPTRSRTSRTHFTTI